MKKLKDYFRSITVLFSLARDVFPYTLLAYLVLFLLENLLPGFVSNNFSLNLVLVAVLVFGFLAAFAPEDKQEREKEQVTPADYFLTAGLGVLGAVIVYAKMDASLAVRLMTAIVSGGLVVLVGLVVLFGEDEKEEPEIVEEVRTSGETPSARVSPGLQWAQITRLARAYIRLLLVRRVQLPLAAVLVFAVFTAFLIPKNTALISGSLRRTEFKEAAKAPSPTPSPEPFFWDDFNRPEYIEPSGDIQILILNGGAEQGMAASISALLKEKGFANVTPGNAERYDYTGATVYFHPQDKAQASVVKSIIAKLYPLVLDAPAEATASGITVILGEKKEAPASPSENEIF